MNKNTADVNITDVNKIDLRNLPEDKINQLSVSVIIDNIDGTYDLQNLSNEDKIGECINYIQDPQNNFLNYDKDKIEVILSSIFYYCENTQNIYEKLSAQQIIGFQKMLQANSSYNIFEDMAKHIDNGSHLEDKFLEIAKLMNNDGSLPVDFTVNFFSAFPKLKKLHEENKSNLDVNDIFNEILLENEKFWEHPYLPCFSILEETLNYNLIIEFLISCHNSKESGFALVDFHFLKKYIDIFGYESGENKLLKFADKINNQENMPNDVVERFFSCTYNYPNNVFNNWDTKYELLKKIYEKISIDKLFQYKDVISFENMSLYLSEEKFNQILEIFHNNNENNYVFAKSRSYWNKYADKFGKEALKEKFFEIANDINNENISPKVAEKFLSSLLRYSKFEIKESVNQVSVDKILQFKAFKAIDYIDNEERLNKVADFCYSKRNLYLLFKHEKLFLIYINKFGNEPNEIKHLLFYAKNKRLDKKIPYSSIKSNIFNLSPDIIFEIFSDKNEIKDAILSNLDKINENNKSNLALLLEKYIGKNNVPEEFQALINLIKNKNLSPEQTSAHTKLFFKYIELQQEQQFDETNTKSTLSSKNKNRQVPKQVPKQEQQEK